MEHNSITSKSARNSLICNKYSKLNFSFSLISGKSSSSFNKTNEFKVDYMKLKKKITIKGSRYDYKIHSPKKIPTEYKQLPEKKDSPIIKNSDNSNSKTVENLRKNNMKIPSRYFLVNENLNNKIRPSELLPKIQGDLKILRDINYQSLVECFNLEKKYGHYLPHYQDLPADNFLDDVKYQKKVTFNE